MKKIFFPFLMLLVCNQLIAQIRCTDVNCVTEGDLRYAEIPDTEDLVMIEDQSNPIPIVVFDSLGFEMEQMSYQLIPLNGCMKACDEKNLVEISYYENGKQQGPRLTYGPDGEVMSKGHYFNNHKIGEHIKYDKNREVVQRVNYDQFGKKHGEEMIFRGDDIEFIVYEHGKSVSTTFKKVKKK